MFNEMEYKQIRLINTKGHEEYFSFCSMYNLGISNYYVKILSRERRLLSRQTKLILLVSLLHEVCISGHYLQQLDAQEETSMSRKCSLTSFFLHCWKALQPQILWIFFYYFDNMGHNFYCVKVCKDLDISCTVRLS